LATMKINRFNFYNTILKYNFKLKLYFIMTKEKVKCYFTFFFTIRVE